MFCILASSKIIFAQTNIWEKRLTFSSPKVRDSTFKGKIIKEDNLGNYYTYFFTDKYVNGICRINHDGVKLWDNLWEPKLYHNNDGTKVERHKFITYLDIGKEDNCKTVGTLRLPMFSDYHTGDFYFKGFTNNGITTQEFFSDTLSTPIYFGGSPSFDKLHDGLICGSENYDELELIRIDGNNKQVWKKKIKDPKYYHDDPRIKRAKNGDYVVYVSLVFPGYSPTGITKLIRTDS
ncbi:MAG: hypothetical protein WAT89_08085 [Candidatus Kapaibacterium sp.]